MFFLSDIDLTGFGPYYGDVWSDLDDFEASLVKVRDEHAEHYVTFHHKGVIDGRDAFVEMLDDFHAVIGRRHDGDARLPRRAAHDRRDGRPPVRVPARTSRSDVRRPSSGAPPTSTSSGCSPAGEAVEVEPGRFQRPVTPAR